MEHLLPIWVLLKAGEPLGGRVQMLEVGFCGWSLKALLEKQIGLRALKEIGTLREDQVR